VIRPDLPLIALSACKIELPGVPCKGLGQLPASGQLPARSRKA